MTILEKQILEVIYSCSRNIIVFVNEEWVIVCHMTAEAIGTTCHTSRLCMFIAKSILYMWRRKIILIN